MNCSDCQHWNPEDEQRCRLCGRKLNSSADDTNSEWLLNVVAGNLAAAPERTPKRRSPEAPTLGQQRLPFTDRPVSKIIPFESRGGAATAAAPARIPVMERKPERPAAKAASPRAPLQASRHEMQPELDLMLPPAPVVPRTLKTKVEASIICDATVATLPHRMLAGAVDFSLILIEYVILVSSYFAMGGAPPTNRLGYLVFGAVFMLIATFYGLIWAMGNTETPGMNWAKLRLTNFDGQDPEIGERMVRYFGTCLSVATCGCGLLWALVDEENLAWQDHMSKTFPTFHRPETNLCTSR